MISFPGTDKEVGQLQQFLAATENMPADAALAEMRDRAIAHADRLSNAVNIGFAGEIGAGKSSLANMLAGADILPTGPDHTKLPLVIVTYADEPETSVGWWDKEPKTYSGIVLDKAAADNPDFVTIGLDTPALREISLFDLPGSGLADDPYDQTLEMLKVLDCAIWCTNGLSPWKASEQHLWSQVPAGLKDNSLLAMTHADLPQVRAGLGQSLDQLNQATDGLFRTVVSIGTPDAVRAMAQEPQPDFVLWQECGGQALAEKVLEAASNRRQMDLEAAQHDLSRDFLPLLDKLNKNRPEPAAPEQVSLQSAINSTIPTLDNPVLEDWLAAIEGIYAGLHKTSEMEPTAFLESCREVVEDFADRLDRGGELESDADWIPADFHKATDLLVLLQFESGEEPMRDAIRILAQLEDNLAWAGSSVATLHPRTGT